jgi:hypothetical protein
VANAAMMRGHKSNPHQNLLFVADLLLIIASRFVVKNSNEKISARIMHSDLHHLALNLIQTPYDKWFFGIFSDG